ncbi:hypothetical protein GCM10011515_17880 [Tsuneonella deserti]|uniref:Uncharacterized protein n=1 Tax=Tsuneonella deserti TaxID=2035528 RepID=A0ABQ1SC31_9SPHN|nr:hypothetical protein [Tsuneonella deserti]GGD98472.1 hypothetical protein GCM10011515_17880 [Tsuneonella deserti]
MLRFPRPNEAKSIDRGDGKLIVIVERPDGLFSASIDRVGFDEEQEAHYWAVSMEPERGLFGSIEEAEREFG